jgi:DNA polymerase III, epsilon subunit and related 3''-5'' exonucleases
MLSLRNIVNTEQPGWPEYMAGRAAEARDERLKRFFAAGVPDPEMPLKDVRMMALDLETTGMDVNRHGIVSIGMVPFTINRIQGGRSYYRIVRPRRLLREESVVIHHITHSEIANAPDLNDVLGGTAGASDRVSPGGSLSPD